jgi:hypothetical protein
MLVSRDVRSIQGTASDGRREGFLDHPYVEKYSSQEGRREFNVSQKF